jgi:mRNA-degrading endonuclease HigB of HigAB toxin-antitoxin module
MHTVAKETAHDGFDDSAHSGRLDLVTNDQTLANQTWGTVQVVEQLYVAQNMLVLDRFTLVDINKFDIFQLVGPIAANGRADFRVGQYQTGQVLLLLRKNP